MDTITAIHTRRSIRAYEPRPVPRALIEAVVLDAVQAPSPPVSGALPWTFSVVEGVERIAALDAEAKAYARAHRTAPGQYGWAGRAEFKVFWDPPAVIVMSGRDGVAEAIFDCNRAGQTLMLSAHARGLGTCWVGAAFPWLASPEAKAALAIPQGFTPMAAFSIGYPAIVPQGEARPKPQIAWV
jgi:nitroreductase